jgi:PAS domain-containing protein
MQIQLGKRRQELEIAFADRTAELRTVTECELEQFVAELERSLPSDSPGGIFRCDGDGEVIYANSSWCVRIRPVQR